MVIRQSAKRIPDLSGSQPILRTPSSVRRALSRPLLAVFVIAALVSTQGNSAPDPTERIDPRSSVSSKDSTAASWDSIYAGIQAGFLTLRPIFQRGCFDCHSDQTNYPWYHSLPGIRGMLDKDIRVARKRLNMSEGFPFGNHVRPADDLSRIQGELEEHSMPPWEYRLMHWNANPTAAERDSVISWIDASLKLLAAHGQYPFGLPSESPEPTQGKQGSDSSN